MSSCVLLGGRELEYFGWGVTLGFAHVVSILCLLEWELKEVCPCRGLFLLKSCWYYFCVGWCFIRMLI
jgi:hypothetical protein